MLLKKWVRSSFGFKHVLTIIAAICCLVAAMILFSDSIASMRNYMTFLKSRSYNYSIVINKRIDEDCYAYYNKTILFSNSESMDQTINAVALMEIGNKHTLNDFLYEYDVELKENEILVSLNLAKKYSIEIGSVVYSRSKLTNKVDSYVVKDILTDIYGVNEADSSRDKGIIVVGKNEKFLNNIQTDFIYFYNSDYSKINQQGARISGVLNSLEKTKLNNAIVFSFYLFITIGLLFLISLLSVFMLSSFNIAVYKKRREYGIKKMYVQIGIDHAIYEGLLVIGSCGAYLILCSRFRFALESLISLIIVLSIVYSLSFIVIKKIIKKGASHV